MGVTVGVIRSWVWEQKKSCGGRMEGGSTVRKNWNPGGDASLGQARNLGQWELPGIYKGDPKTSSNGGYRACTAQLRKPIKTSNDRFRTPIHPENLWPTVYPTYKICRDKDRAKIEGEANKLLVWIENPCHEREPIPDTISDILLYLQTGAHHNCHQKDFYQKLMETDGRDSQTNIRWSLGNLAEKGEEGL